VDLSHRLHESSPSELKQRLEAERGGAPFVVLRDGDGRQRIVELTADRSPVTIGRQPASRIALTWDDEVSRAHADVECIGDVWTLVDDGRSRNGSFVNGERVHGRRPLHDGDVIAIGRTLLTYAAPPAGAERSTAAGANRMTVPMSPAQRRVLLALCRPFASTRFATPPSNRQLAEELCLSVETVKFHLHALFEAFGLADVPQHRKRATLAQLALERGAITPRELLGG
jgi:pSer/pThr/pTyr-binding forkhead associated (FHA) protein